jgi:hypothetical protein
MRLKIRTYMTVECATDYRFHEALTTSPRGKCTLGFAAVLAWCVPGPNPRREMAPACGSMALDVSKQPHELDGTTRFPRANGDTGPIGVIGWLITARWYFYFESTRPWARNVAYLHAYWLPPFQNRIFTPISRCRGRCIAAA